MKMDKRQFSASKARFICLGVVVLFVSISSAVQAGQNVTLGWNAETNVAGYVLYYGTNSGSYTSNYTYRIDAGTNLSATATNLQPGQNYYFAVTAYNSARAESAPSTPIAYLVTGILTMAPPSKTTPLTIKFPVAPGHTYIVQGSTDLKKWTNLWSMGTASSNAWVSYQITNTKSFKNRFYRLSMSP